MSSHSDMDTTEPAFSLTIRLAGRLPWCCAGFTHPLLRGLVKTFLAMATALPGQLVPCCGKAFHLAKVILVLVLTCTCLQQQKGSQASDNKQRKGSFLTFMQIALEQALKLRKGKYARYWYLVSTGTTGFQLTRKDKSMGTHPCQPKLKFSPQV